MTKKEAVPNSCTSLRGASELVLEFGRKSGESMSKESKLLFHVDVSTSCVSPRQRLQQEINADQHRNLPIRQQKKASGHCFFFLLFTFISNVFIKFEQAK